jgi:ribose transport system substrate-binding protein
LQIGLRRCAGHQDSLRRSGRQRLSRRWPECDAGLPDPLPEIDGLFAINDPQAIGSDLAAKQLKRSGIIITSVDGAPDIEQALKADTSIQASASQDPWAMAQQAVVIGNDLLNDKKPAEAVTQLTPKLITRDNVGSYSGWSSKH